jgi:hypothetical protein
VGPAAGPTTGSLGAGAGRIPGFPRCAVFNWKPEGVTKYHRFLSDMKGLPELSHHDQRHQPAPFNTNANDRRRHQKRDRRWAHKLTRSRGYMQPIGLPTTTLGINRAEPVSITSITTKHSLDISRRIRPG